MRKSWKIRNAMLLLYRCETLVIIFYLFPLLHILLHSYMNFRFGIFLSWSWSMSLIINIRYLRQQAIFSQAVIFLPVQYEQNPRLSQCVLCAANQEFNWMSFKISIVVRKWYLKSRHCKASLIRMSNTWILWSLRAFNFRTSMKMI